MSQSLRKTRLDTDLCGDYIGESGHIHFSLWPQQLFHLLFLLPKSIITDMTITDLYSHKFKVTLFQANSLRDAEALKNSQYLSSYH